ncbi:TetR/AcrR family transcriptional regulator [Streptomyces sp. NPDC090088]|uniref:TetR/AcrR family transcriptional regulator n=1 Tax=Streptomyces sp. NPDC090088 TaxID=3365944 RepID=UPI003800F985
MSTVRADAARNAAQIRQVALTAFASNGLDVPLEEIAAKAGVSKATVYNRFGGRGGLIDSVVDELVATYMLAVVQRADALADPWQKLELFITGNRDLLYQHRAAIDVILNRYPESERIAELCDACADACRRIVAQGRAAGVLREDFHVNDLYDAFVTTALALKHGPRPARADFRRRTRFFIDGIRAAARADDKPSEGRSGSF